MADATAVAANARVCPVCHRRFRGSRNTHSKGPFHPHALRPDAAQIVSRAGVPGLADAAGNWRPLIRGRYCWWHIGMRG